MAQELSPDPELERLRFLCDAVDQTAVRLRVDSAGNFIEINEHFARLSGFTVQELLGKVYFGVLSADFSPSLIQDIKKNISQSITWHGELCCTTKNGGSLWIEVSIIPYVDPVLNQKQSLIIGFDVSERKSIQKALIENRNFLNTLMDFAPIGVFLTDSQGQCTYVNHRWAEITGMGIRKAYSSHWLEGVDAADRVQVREAWVRLVTRETPFVMEYRYRHPNGKEIWVLATAVKLSQEITGISGFLRVEQDITEKKKQEKTIEEQRARLIHSSKMTTLGEIAGGIAHEINNPLTIILARAERMTTMLQEGSLDSEWLGATTDKFLDTTARIARIVKALKTIGQDGESEGLKHVEVGTLIDNALQVIMERAKLNNIQIHLNPIPKELGIECRPVQITQMILNLLLNAYAAVESLQERWIQVAVLDRKDQIEIRITDSGLGIPDELREKIFQPFFTTREVGTGSGLGLSVSKAIAEGHGGTLKLATDSPNTCFSIQLPKKQEEDV